MSTRRACARRWITRLRSGSELFVIDAGWYTGADTDNPSDFDQGLGTWEVDPARFPNGLSALKDYAHGPGMNFGIWVEPNASTGR